MQFGLVLQLGKVASYWATHLLFQVLVQQVGSAWHSASVYWVSVGTFQTTGQTDGALYKVPIGGGSITTLATQQAGPTAVAVDSSSVYWVATFYLWKATPK